LNTYLIGRGAIDIQKSAVIGLVVETGCQYLAPLTYPEEVTAGLRVGHIGRSSVRYEIALFGQGRGEAAAQGHFVHVYVDRDSRRPVDLPPALRSALEPLRVPVPSTAP
jgi:acyl-CoA thioester hydrolase